MLSHPGDITIFSCFSTTISGLKVRKSISLKCKRQLEGELEWGTLCLNYGFWQCLASPLWTVAWNCTPSVKWGAPVSVHSQLLFSVSLVCYRASSKVYLCIVCTHASCHRMRLYIYIYTYVYYIFIYVTFVDPCTCGNEQGKTKQKQLRIVRDKTLRREHNSHIANARAHTHTHRVRCSTRRSIQRWSQTPKAWGESGKGVCSRGRSRGTGSGWQSTDTCRRHARTRARVQLNGALNALPSVSKREQCRPRIHAYSALTPVTGRRMKAVLSAADGPTGEEKKMTLVPG